jgi:hypothetical protein
MSAINFSSFANNFKLFLGITAILMNLGFGVYAAVILGKYSIDSVPVEIYAYTLTFCISQFTSTISNLCLFVADDNKTSNSANNLIGLGLFVWSCVILFREKGIDLIHQNPYYMLIYAGFLATVVFAGVALILLPLVTCLLLTSNKLGETNDNMIMSSIYTSSKKPTTQDSAISIV